MPSNNTITATDFNVFVAGTKAKAAEVNTNFGFWRGHVMPLDPNTITAASNTYDLGAGDDWWRTAYIGTSMVFKGATTTTQFSIVPNPTSTTGSVDFILAGQTIATFRAGITGGFASTFNPTFGTTVDYTIGASVTITGENIAGMTVTIATNGNPVLVMLSPDTSAYSISNASGLTTLPGYFLGHTGGSAAQTQVFSRIAFVRDTITTHSPLMTPMGVIISSTAAHVGTWPASTFWWIDYNVPAGTHHYSLNIFQGPANTYGQIRRLRIMAAEIKL